MIAADRLIEDFERMGFVGPFDLLEPQEAREISKEAWKTNATLPWAVHFRAHEQIPVLRRLALSPAVLRVVSAILGPEVIFWGARYMAHIGAPGEVKSPRWHQEVDFCRVLGRGASVSGVQLYLALDEATHEVGTMQALAGTHKDFRFDVESIYDEKTLLDPKVNGHQYSRNVVGPLVKAAGGTPVDLTAKPGQFYVFDWKVVHQRGIDAVTSSRRLTVNARYTTPASTFDSPAYLERFSEPLRCVEGGTPLPTLGHPG